MYFLFTFLQTMAPRPKQEDESEGKPTKTLDGMNSEHLSKS